VYEDEERDIPGEWIDKLSNRTLNLILTTLILLTILAFFTVG